MHRLLYKPRGMLILLKANVQHRLCTVSFSVEQGRSSVWRRFVNNYLYCLNGFCCQPQSPRGFSACEAPSEAWQHSCRLLFAQSYHSQGYRGDSWKLKEPIHTGVISAVPHPLMGRAAAFSEALLLLQARLLISSSFLPTSSCFLSAGFRPSSASLSWAIFFFSPNSHRLLESELFDRFSSVFFLTSVSLLIANVNTHFEMREND